MKKEKLLHVCGGLCGLALQLMAVLAHPLRLEDFADVTDPDRPYNKI